jgi:lysozyme family protein
MQQEVDSGAARPAKPACGREEHALDPASAFDRQPGRPIYPGLAAFDIDDAAIFFGRSQESSEVVAALDRMRLQAPGNPKLLLITGASGVGKSSLMRAGVLARLRNEPASWMVPRPLRGGAGCMDVLADMLMSLYPAAQRPAREATIGLLAGAEGPSRLLAMARELRAALERPEATLLLAIDQAEELLEAEAAEESAKLLDLLRAALTEVGNEIVVVATIRSDRLGADGRHGGLAFEMMPLGPLRSEHIGEIVRGPAACEGLGVEDELVEAMRADLDNLCGLPVLACTLRYMHDRLGSDRKLSLASYRSFGGPAGSARRPDDAAMPVDRLREPQRMALREAFVPDLVRVKSDGKFTRTRARPSMLPRLAEPYLRRTTDEARSGARLEEAPGEVEEREARGRELRAAQDLARRRRRQAILASVAAVVILAFGGAATWMFRELAATRGTQLALLQHENSVLSQLLRQEYQQRFDSARVAPARQELVAQSVRRILDNRARYERITRSITMPWYFLAIIHGLEADFRFDLHLHNGDPLTGRTAHVPAGRPAQGTPPFTWEESARDAITVNRYDKWNDWSIAGMLVAWESYNGLGYRHHGINSPYVWACTDLYVKGRYVADGRFDANAESKQCGAVAMLKGLISNGSVSPPPGPR